LCKILAKVVAQLLFDNSYLNLKENGIYYDLNTLLEDFVYNGNASVMLTYTPEQKVAEHNAAIRFIDYYKNTRKSVFLDDTAFTKIISNIISYTAWQEYYTQNYTMADSLINRLIAYNVANDEDFYLKIKLMKILYDRERYLAYAPVFINAALENQVIGIYNLYSEKALLLFELKQYRQAKDTFKEYYEIIKSNPNEAKNQKWARQMMYKCDLFMDN